MRQRRIILCIFTLAAVDTGIPNIAFSQGAEWGEDWSGNGRDDHFFDDFDDNPDDPGYGNPDLGWIDLDEDGNLDEEWRDCDDDGDWDRRLRDKDDDGDYDNGDGDANENGTIDEKWVDRDSDGRKDANEWRAVPERGQGSFPDGPRPREQRSSSCAPSPCPDFPPSVPCETTGGCCLADRRQCAPLSESDCLAQGGLPTQQCGQDADGDGVDDACDLCPDSLAGAATNQFGCPPKYSCDTDRDGDVDYDDLAWFDSCISGPRALFDRECGANPDVNSDNDVDLADFAKYQQCFAGPNVLPAPECLIPQDVIITEDVPFRPPTVRSDGSPMPDPSVANNITRVTLDIASEVKTVLRLEEPPGLTNQYGVAIDKEADGVCDLWVHISDPRSKVASLTDERFNVIGSLPIALSDDRKEISFTLPIELVGDDPALVVFTFDRALAEYRTPLFILGEQIEMLPVNVAARNVAIDIVVDTATMNVVQLAAKHSPPDGCAGCCVVRVGARWHYAWNDVIGLDVNGHLFVVSWWSIGGNFYKRVKHDDDGDGMFEPGEGDGWFATCPYVGGCNSEEYKRNAAGNLVVQHRVEDHGADDDGDGKRDVMFFVYDLDKHQHSASHHENGLQVTGHDAPPHPGPHAAPGDLEFWR